jgi:protein-disulfide isomerase
MSSKAIRNTIFLVIIMAIIVVLCVIFIPRGTPTAVLPKAVQIDTKNQPMMGNKSAPLHIVAFEDLKCSNCMRYNTTVFPKIYEHYIKPGKANYTIITLAFIPGSMPAANAARCVYDQSHDAYFDYVKYIYNNQPPENVNWATVPNLMLYATHVKGINSDKLAQCIVKSPYTQMFNDNLKILQGIMKPPVGTPSLYINGVKVDPLSWKRFQQVTKELQ